MTDNHELLYSARDVELLVAERTAELDGDLATARTVTRRLLDGWLEYYAKDATWVHRFRVAEREPMSDAEQAWLASVSPPTSGEEP